MRPILQAIIRDGRVEYKDPALARTTIESYEGREVEISIARRSNKRTAAENRYYWGVIVKMVSDEMHITPDEAHEFLKGLFLKIGVQGKHDERVFRFEVMKSTANLPINEFEDYCEKSRNWAMTELNINIPLPNEVEI